LSANDPPKKPIKTRIISSTVIVPDIESSSLLFEKFYGKPLGSDKPRPGEVKTPLVLDPIETVYLESRGIIEVYLEDRKLRREDLIAWAREKIQRFDLLYPIYRSLRDMGLVVRPGLKFGGDFTVYRRGPGIDHSLFVVHSFPWPEARDPVELVKAGRLSHSVRKTFVLATVEPGGEPVFLMLKWYKP